MHKLNWDDFRFVLAVARQGSLSAAARTLRVSQPTVGRRIEQLEQQVGQALFERDCQGVRLNDTGQAILRFIEAMDREAEGVGNYLSDSNRAPRPTVRVATTFNLANFWLTWKIAALAARNPAIRFEVQVGIQKVDLQRYCADIALRMGDPDDETLFGRRVGQVHCGLYASQAYLTTHGQPEGLPDLRQHRIVGAAGAVENLPQCAALREITGSAGCDFFADNTNVQLTAAKAGLGIAPLPCCIAAGEAGLVRVLPEVFDIPVDLWVLINRDLKDRRPVRETYDFILREAVKDSQLFKGMEESNANRTKGQAGKLVVVRTLPEEPIRLNAPNSAR